MKIVTYNVNGIRAALKKGFYEWLKATDPDVVCLQEVKAEANQVELSLFTDLGYEIHWHAAVKKGYSGVAIFTKIKPKDIKIGCGENLYDNEGRVIQIDFEDVSVINTYMPSGTTGDERQNFKMTWLDFFYDYANYVKQEVGNLVICGDYNICHTSIDIHNPVANKNTSGFKPEEREWVTKFIESGFIDKTGDFIVPIEDYVFAYDLRLNKRVY